MEEDYTTTTRGKGAKPTGHQHSPPSKSDLMSSAKLLANAAKSTISHDSSSPKPDKAQLAAAGADLLSAAKQYGKFEDKSYGKYFDKAEGYLHKYSSSNSPTSSPPSSATHHGGGDGKHGYSGSGGGGEGKHGHEGSGGGGSGGGYGEYIKMAQGFMKKPDESHGGEGKHGHSGSGGGDGSGGGAGDYIKMAQGFLKKDDHGDGGGHGSSGDYIKLAQGFLKKH